MFSCCPLFVIEAVFTLFETDYIKLGLIYCFSVCYFFVQFLLMLQFASVRRLLLGVFFVVAVVYSCVLSSNSIFSWLYCSLLADPLHTKCSSLILFTILSVLLIGVTSSETSACDKSDNEALTYGARDIFEIQLICCCCQTLCRWFDKNNIWY